MSVAIRKICANASNLVECEVLSPRGVTHGIPAGVGRRILRGVAMCNKSSRVMAHFFSRDIFSRASVAYITGQLHARDLCAGTVNIHFKFTRFLRQYPLYGARNASSGT